ncbi:MAG TPA: PilN domain-containing protein [Thermoanaerobaculia bacterium]|nr:PilN domain-containing protein [Thermoanaerobaculia bacterium]
MNHLNLSRRPFLNTRPVTRVSLVLWVLGALLLLGNVTLFWNYLSGSTEKRAELIRMEEQVERERESVGRLEARIAGLDLGEQNELVGFLNRKIAERTFSWSLLFDRLAQTLPDNVRLLTLQPSGLVGDGRERRSSRTSGPAPLASDRVVLLIAAEAKDEEQMSRFVDNLFGHPSFADPDFTDETQTDQGNLRFSLHVNYLPRNGTPGVTVEEEPEVVEETPAANPAATPADDDSETE